METIVVHCLAYGSNLHPFRLAQRVPSAKPVGVVPMPGRRLAFHKRSDRDGSGKCLFYEPGGMDDIMYGVVYEFDSKEKRNLDILEGLGKGYNEQIVSCALNNQQYQPYVYVAASTHIDPSSIPYDWYKEMVVLGAQYHGLPNDYVRKIDAIPSIPDLDSKRVAENRETLVSMRRINALKGGLIQMSEDPSLPELPLKRRAHDVPELSERTLQTYSRLWQLETWLRHMVYVELRAKFGDDWKTIVRLEKTALPLKSDKALSHMPTPEENPLSYAQLSKLRQIITETRSLFDPFLPPEKIWDARMDEIAQIRHRVAHFRQGNVHDLDRVVELLRDIDKGLWKFCTSYNDGHPVLPQTDDPVVAYFLPLDLLPWVEVSERSWARVGSIPDSKWFCVTVEAILRPWATWATPVAGKEGILYDVDIFIRGRRRYYFDYPQLLKNTKFLHTHFVHIGLDDRAERISLTIPAVLGEKVIIEILEAVINSARSCAYPGEWPSYKGTVKSFAETWPEYVLEPYHPLTMLTSDMPCSIFGL